MLKQNILKKLALLYDLNSKSVYGKTALMYESENGYIEVVKVLIERALEVNAIYKEGLIALFN